MVVNFTNIRCKIAIKRYRLKNKIKFVRTASAQKIEVEIDNDKVAVY